MKFKNTPVALLGGGLKLPTHSLWWTPPWRILVTLVVWRFESNVYAALLNTLLATLLQQCVVCSYCVKPCELRCRTVWQFGANVSFPQTGGCRFTLIVGNFILGARRHIPENSILCIVRPTQQCSVTAPHLAAIQFGPTRTATQRDLARRPRGALTYKECQNVLSEITSGTFSCLSVGRLKLLKPSGNFTYTRYIH
jgi:hypothetical protein